MYIKFDEEARKKLRKPFGKKTNVEKIKTKRKIIAVGDETTLRLIAIGTLPHLAVCDFKIKRKNVGKDQIEKLKRAFGGIKKTYKNPPGTLSTAILKNAKKHIREGGLIRIIGEEDITALAFMLFGGKKHLVLYGQPNEGLVEVKPENKKLKIKIKRLLSSISFHHKEKRGTDAD